MALQRMDDWDCCDEIDSKDLKEGMTATAS